MEEKLNHNIYGWDSEGDVALEVYYGSFRNLLEGNLVFAYKNSSSSGTVKFLVVTKTNMGFRFGFISQSGWTCYYPLVDPEYLRQVLVDDLKKNKTDKKIIDDFIKSIDYYDEAKHTCS